MRNRGSAAAAPSAMISRLPAGLCLLGGLLLALPAVAQQATTVNVIEQNKGTVERFLALANAGEVAQLPAMVREDYIEHADLPDRLAGLQATIALNRQSRTRGDVVEERRRIRGDLVRMIAERDHVWVHLHVRGPAGRVARIDMFRLQDGQLAEHWAVVEPVEEKRRNDNDNFAGGRGVQDFTRQPRRVTQAASAPVLERNREVARLFYQYFEVRDDAALRTIMREDYIQHNAGAGDGREGLLVNMPAFRARVAEEAKRRAAAGEPPAAVEGGNELIRMLAEGDLVWVFVRDNGGERAQFNQFRVTDGMLSEHWGTYQDIPAVRQNANTFFGFGRGPAPDYTR